MRNIETGDEDSRPWEQSKTSETSDQKITIDVYQPKSSDGVRKVVPVEGPDFQQQAGGGPVLHIVLIEPEIAGNVGAIGRTCVAAGGMLWLVRPLGFFIDDRTLKRAGLDYWEHLRWRVVDSLEQVTAEVGGDRVWILSARATRVYTDAEFLAGDVVVFGPESRGLAREWIERFADRALRIPIQAEARSLNLGSAVAVVTFELLRQVGWPARAVSGEAVE